jgi:hypothetical protein
MSASLAKTKTELQTVAVNLQAVAVNRLHRSKRRWLAQQTAVVESLGNRMQTPLDYLRRRLSSRAKE